MKLNDLRIKIWYGATYYRAEKTEILVYDVNDGEYLKENCDKFNTQEIFLGVDGKHSQIYGDLLEEESKNCTELDIIKFINDSSVDNRIFDFYGSDEETESYKKLKLAYDYACSFKVDKKYVHKETKEILNMDDYIQKEFIIKKEY